MIGLIKRKLKSYFIDNLSIPNLSKSLQRINQLGYKPAAIFDVGAYKGDFARLCLDVWPNANIVCFEPIEEKAKLLQDWADKDSRITVIQGLLGDENNDSVKFNESETASSVLDEFISKDFNTKYHRMRTLDRCIAEFKLNPPNILKIDTQGFEYQILQGIKENLQHVEVIIAELNFIDIHENVKLAGETIAFLKGYDFVVYDITEIHRRPYDKAMWQADFMFVKKDSVFRQDKRWV
ncbi:MAG: FkbM family methyltransferase [Bacteroidota bacterium]